MIIIMRFGENNILCPKYINIYEFGWDGGDVHIPPFIFCLLFKKRKKYTSMTYTKIKFYIILISKNFPRMNNNFFTKSVDFIAILLTPGTFLI